METHVDRPRPPADQGLSSLGLLMALVGSVMAPLGAAQLVALYRANAELGRFGDAPPGQSWLLLVIAAGFLRALVHRQTGIRLWRYVPTDPPVMIGIDRYLIAGAAHTVACLGYVGALPDVSTSRLVAVGAVCMAWPFALHAISRRPRFRALGARPPLAEDSGFEGLAVLLAVLGFVGLLGSLVIAVLFLSMESFSTPSTPLLMIGAGALVVRSLYQVVTGVRAVQGDPLTSGLAFRRYGDVGINAAMVAGACLIVWTIFHGVDLIALAQAVAAMVALIAWPALVRRYVIWREGGDGDQGRVRVRSPDAGLSALGWLLLGLGVFSLAGAVFGALGDPDAALAGRVLLLGVPLAHDLTWWAVPLALAEIWAALELLAVSPRRRLAATLWGTAAVVVTIVARHDEVRRLLDASLKERAIGLAGLLMLLTPAIATLLLVNRERLPRAIARVRPRATDSSVDAG